MLRVSYVAYALKALKAAAAGLLRSDLTTEWVFPALVASVSQSDWCDTSEFLVTAVSETRLLPTFLTAYCAAVVSQPGHGNHKHAGVSMTSDNWHC